MRDLKVVLEDEKVSENYQNEMFYRYRIGDFKLWFSQADNGNIYSVGFVEDGDELRDFELHVYADEYGRGGYYPNVFEIRLRSFAMTTSEVRDYLVKAEKACAVLDTVENFFKNSKHFALYAEKHGIEVPKCRELEGADGDFPTLAEIQRDYRELMGIIGDIKTIAQAREVAEKYGIQVRIDGHAIESIDGRITDANFDWIHIGAYGCLRSIYHYLHEGLPEFDVWSNAWGGNFLNEITVDDLTEENYREWIDSARAQVGAIETEQDTRDDLSQVGEEMISRGKLLADIICHFKNGGKGRSSVDDDCKKAWGVIENYRLEDGDLVSRVGLLDAVLDEFGCDLAYYGRDLQFFQDAIAGVPAARQQAKEQNTVDGLINEAKTRTEDLTVRVLEKDVEIVP